MNEIHDLVQKAGFNPADFIWSDEESVLPLYGRRVARVTISVITHRPSSCFCKFGVHSVEFSPGVEGRTDSKIHFDAWTAKSEAVERWLEELAAEIEAPDLWASVLQEKALVDAATSTEIDNRPFTAHERKLIFPGLEEIKGLLKEGQAFEAAQAETVEKEFAYLREAADRLGRKDWLLLLIGSLMSLAIGLALDPSKTRSIMQAAAVAFQSLWTSAQGLLQ